MALLCYGGTVGTRLHSGVGKVEHRDGGALGWAEGGKRHCVGTAEWGVAS